MNTVKLWLGLLAAALAVAGCECRKTACVEPAEVPELAALSARTCGEASGSACVWDFAGGRTPEGGRLEKAARVTSGGLACAAVTNEAVRAGCWLEGTSTPEGAFLLEADVVLGNAANAVLHRQREGLLWDDMGVNYKPKRDNRGLQVVFSQGPAGSWSPYVCFGTGADVCRVSAPSCKRFAPGEVAHFALFYGANGRVVIDFGGETVDAEIPFRGPLAKSGRTAVIGSRQIGNYFHFDGIVKRVSLTPMKVEPFALSAKGPTAFERGSSDARLILTVANCTGAALAEARAEVEQFTSSGRVRKFALPLGDIAAQGESEIRIPLETRIRPGWHPLRVTVSGRTADGRPVSFAKLVRYGVGPRFADRMGVQMWGFNEDVDDIAHLGFTSGLSYLTVAREPPREQLRRVLDEALVKGVGIYRAMKRIPYPAGKDEKSYMRRKRSGTAEADKYFEIPEVSHPDLRREVAALAEADAKEWRDYPAYIGVNAFSEIRDAAFPSFNTEHLRYKAETGRDVPATVSQKSHTWRDLKEMKARYPTGIVPEDDPELLFYRWYWKGGDGWPGYQSAIADAYRRHMTNPRFRSYWDPAVRCPPIWGAGGSVDLINQWCYALPEPLNVAGPCEEMLTMAEGRPGQEVAIMTQLICYRAWLAPKDVKVEPVPEWVKRLPDAGFPTIPPDHLQEAVWSMLAKPVKAIAFHGWGTIHDTGERKKYCFTNPETRERLRELLHGPVAALGPTLKRLGRARSDVAVFESFTSAVFGGPSSWGWKAPAITLLQRARLDPHVVYEESVLRGDLDGVKVLYAPQCVFLTPSMIEKLRAFQRGGGILAADGQLVSALKPDILLPVVSFDPPPDSDHSDEVDAQEAAKSGDAKSRRATMRAKAFMLDVAEKLRKELAARGYAPATDSSSPEIVSYGRRWEDVPYAVAVNDRRTFGDYVGMYGKTMEKGLPFAGEVSVAAPAGSVGAVYELSRGGKVAFAEKDGRVTVPVSYETNDGRLFAFLKKPIAAVAVDAPRSVKPGEALHVRCTVKDASGEPVRALLPVEVRVLDAAGRELDGAGWACAENGVCELDVRTNLDDASGDYRIVCRDQASGLTAETAVRRCE